MKIIKNFNQFLNESTTTFEELMTKRDSDLRDWLANEIKKSNYDLDLIVKVLQSGKIHYFNYSEIDRYGMYTGDYKDESLLKLAVEKKKCDVLKALLDAGANPNFVIVNNNDDSLLHLAVRMESIECIRVLLDYPGIYVDNPNEDGNTPWDIASNRICNLFPNLKPEEDEEEESTIEKQIKFQIMKVDPDINILIDLVKKLEDINQVFSIDMSSHKDANLNSEIYEYNYIKGDWTLLGISCFKGYSDLVKEILKRPDVDVNAYSTIDVFFTFLSGYVPGAEYHEWDSTEDTSKHTPLGWVIVSPSSIDVKVDIINQLVNHPRIDLSKPYRGEGKTTAWDIAGKTIKEKCPELEPK